MNITAPTFNALNKSQKRALILRDQLRFVDPQHLNGFLEGVSNDEPPTYIKNNGVIKPELTLVTLKEEATRFDLGNVLLPEENNAIYRVYLVVEDGQIQMRAEDPLPQNEDVLDSLPIHGFIARGIVPLFRDKFQAIFSRMNKINEARRTAYNMANQTPASFQEGETLTRLNPPRVEHGQPALQSKNRGKREPNEQVKQHISNKRKRTGLDTISEDTKSKTFDTIPSNVKVDLFNSIVKTAFPNFDNLMMASWNVVSIYSACGSDFPELHRAIVTLKGVLQDFDEAFGRRVNRETPKYREDFGGAPCGGDHASDGQNGPSKLSRGNENTGGIAEEADISTTTQVVSREHVTNTSKNNTEQPGNDPKTETPPPSSPTQPENHDDKEEGEIFDSDSDTDSDQIPCLNPRQHPNPTSQTTTHTSRKRINSLSLSPSPPAFTSSLQQHHRKLWNTSSHPNTTFTHTAPSTTSRPPHRLSAHILAKHSTTPSISNYTKPGANNQHRLNKSGTPTVPISGVPAITNKGLSLSSSSSPLPTNDSPRTTLAPVATMYSNTSTLAQKK